MSFWIARKEISESGQSDDLEGGSREDITQNFRERRSQNEKVRKKMVIKFVDSNYCNNPIYKSRMEPMEGAAYSNPGHNKRKLCTNN